MEREWRDALLITEPSACSWTTSNSTGSWAEERERREGERWGLGSSQQVGEGEKEGERERVIAVGRGWYRGKGEDRRGKNDGPDDL